MPATNTPRPVRLANPASPSSPRAAVADMLFVALKALHGLVERDAELLGRAEAGLRLIQSTARFSAIEQHLFLAALADIDDADAYVVEASARFSADLLVSANASTDRHHGPAETRRALWLAAILRLADALCAQGSPALDNVYAAWTDAILYLEFDAEMPGGSHVERASAKVAALSAVSGRQVVLAASAVRRGAA